MDSDTQRDTHPQTGSEQHSSSGPGLQSLADQLRQQASTRFSGEKDRAIQGLTSLVDAVRQTGQQLRDNDQAGIAGYIDSAADQAAHFSERLGNKDLGEIVDDLQRFAHRRPALFLGLSFGLGIASARFLKSSRPRPQNNRPSGPGLGSRKQGSGSSYAGSGSTSAATGGISAGGSSSPRLAIAPPPAPPSPGSAGPRRADLSTSLTGPATAPKVGSVRADDRDGASTGEAARAPRAIRPPRTER